MGEDGGGETGEDKTQGERQGGGGKVEGGGQSTRPNGKSILLPRDLCNRQLYKNILSTDSIVSFHIFYFKFLHFNTCFQSLRRHVCVVKKKHYMYKY